jgi:epoxyqueuosine reductase
LTAAEIRERARACGFELAGVARAAPVAERAWYRDWAAAGYAGEMRYLTDRRATVREDPRSLLPSARSVVSVGKLYNTAWPLSTRFDEAGRAWISRYAWGEDYHHLIRRGLERLDATLRERAGAGYESRICVDTAPLLERSYARQAGLGWIGKNTCLINQRSGSWFFLGELLVSLDIEPGREDAPPPGRCGTCRRCIEACPTQALVPGPLGYTLDSRRCISYLTIELRGAVPEAHRAAMGRHVFGCDICQDVCPWNRKALDRAQRGGPIAADAELEPRAELINPALEWLASLDEPSFEREFNGSPVRRAGFLGLKRNVAIAMGNSRQTQFADRLEAWATAADEGLRSAAQWALGRLHRA